MKTKLKKIIFYFIILLVLVLFIIIVINSNSNSTVITLEIAKQSIHLEEWEWISEYRLAMYEINEDDVRLCWHFYVGPKDGFAHKLIIIDTRSGEIVATIRLVFDD